MWSTHKAIIAMLGGALVLITYYPARSQPQIVQDTEIGSEWEQAVGIAIAEDGRLFVWERAGRVWVVEDGVKSALPLIDISEEVTVWWDRGFLGFALDPSFLTNGHIYLLYTVDYHHLKFFGTPEYDPALTISNVDTISRLTRYTCNASDGFRTVDLASRHILIGESITTGIPCIGGSHTIGSIVFGHDGSLLLSSGDAAFFGGMDDGGPRPLTSRTALADGIMQPKEDVGAFRAQLVDSLCGKILRVDPASGDGLPDNPFYDPTAPRSARSRVWAMGLRNPFRFTVRPRADHGSRHEVPAPGVLYLGEVGWDLREEIDVVAAPGQNFGWPLFEGFLANTPYLQSEAANADAPNRLFDGGACSLPFFRFRDLLVEDSLFPPYWPNPCDAGVEISSVRKFVHSRPRVEWGHGVLGQARVPIYVDGVAQAALIGEPGSGTVGFQFHGSSSTGGAWFAANGWPAGYEGYYAADFQEGWMHRFIFDEDHRCTEVQEFLPALSGRLITDIESDPTGSALYYVAFDFTGGSSVHRLSDATDRPPIAVASAEPRFGPLPLAVTFRASESVDPEMVPLVYEWDFGDGSPVSNEPDPVHVYDVPGGSSAPMQFDARVTISDTTGNSVIKTFLISPNNSPPSVEIVYPVDGGYFPFEQTIGIDMMTAVADAESPGQTRCVLQVLLHHNEHIHPLVVDDICSTSFEVFSHGQDPKETYFEFRLTVTDPHGLSTVSSASIYPRAALACPGDADQSGSVDLDDLATVILAWGSYGLGASGDVDLDGRVALSDLSLVLLNWDATCPPDASDNALCPLCRTSVEGSSLRRAWGEEAVGLATPACAAAWDNATDEQREVWLKGVRE